MLGIGSRDPHTDTWITWRPRDRYLYNGNLQPTQDSRELRASSKFKKQYVQSYSQDVLVVLSLCVEEIFHILIIKDKIF